jgi:hypothetical protein
MFDLLFFGLGLLTLAGGLIELSIIAAQRAETRRRCFRFFLLHLYLQSISGDPRDLHPVWKLFFLCHGFVFLCFGIDVHTVLFPESAFGAAGSLTFAALAPLTPGR